MTRALWLLILALPAAAQPKLLINAQVSTRSAAAGLEREFRSLLTAQPQPAWVGYTVPSTRTYDLGCEYVSPEGRMAPGVIHLEPPMEALILFRVTAGAVERVRALSPYCELDAGGAQVHWLTEVKPAESVALLSGMEFTEAVRAIAVHATPEADAALKGLIGNPAKDNLQRRAAYWLGAARGRGGVDAVQDLLARGAAPAVERQAVEGLAVNRDPAALDLLMQIARKPGDAGVRKQAINAIGRSRDPRAVAFLEDVLRH